MTEQTRRQRLHFHHQAAYYLTAFFVVALGVAAVVTPRVAESYFHRSLADNEEVDYTTYSCNVLFEVTPDPGDNQCRFAKECNQGAGVFMGWVFCSKLSWMVWCGILSPFLLLWMIMLFRMLGSTAEDYFSPSLEMFSVKLGLPPRFAGVSLLALGNGAADVSATRNAITSDPQHGYLLSLGALSGAAMFIGSVVAGVIVLVADGVPCRGALVRDVLALCLTAAIVLLNLQSGSIGPAQISLFTSLYLVFVAIVLVADVYHRAVVLPRLQRVAEASEVQRQQDESVRANAVAGDVLNELADEQPAVAQQPKRNVFSKFMTAISNYDNTTKSPAEQQRGWGVESDDVINERPVVLHGANGLLTPERAAAPSEEEMQEPSVGNYAMLEDGMDQVCAETGTGSFSANNWRGAWKDGIYEFEMELYDDWRELKQDEDLHIVEKALQISEYPFTVFRKISIPIPCEGYYSRAMVAGSLFLSPLWFAFYMWNEHDLNVFYSPPLFYFHLGVCLILGALVLRYAPGGEGVMNLMAATPLALYGFFMAATWIDWIADHLVALLEFLGIVCGIPGSVMGLTILAWGNSMGDLSANMTMARKGLANMAMTACFAGPVFNILIGLSLGFSSLAAQTGNAEMEVEISPSIISGFCSIITLTLLVIVVGTCFSRGRISKEMGYVMFGVYLVYLTLSLVLQFTNIGGN